MGENARNTREAARDRILAAALQALAESGYAATSTLEIATRAQVSKRELYALFGNKRPCWLHASWIGQSASGCRPTYLQSRIARRSRGPSE